MKQPAKTGTREWSDVSYNIAEGCAHGCLYCYARAAAQRFIPKEKRLTGEAALAAWQAEKLKTKLPRVPKPKIGQITIMFPTRHDITPALLPAALEAISSMLVAGWPRVLIVSKPHPECIAAICERFIVTKERIMFRFSIGARSDGLLSQWEPGAPTFAERFCALRHAFEQGFATTVSMEPYLSDVEPTVNLFHELAPFVSDKIWIGKMNKIEQRVPEKFSILRQQAALWCDDDHLQRIIWALQHHPKIAWKDSVQHLL